MKTSFWFFIVVAVLLVTFSVQNSAPTEVSFLVWTVQISKAVLIIATFLIGLVTGALYGYFSRKPAKVKATDIDPEEITTVKEDETETSEL